MSLIKQLAEHKIRLDRGNSLVSWGKNVLLLAASLKVILPLISYAALAGLVLLALIAIYMLGYIDIKFLKLFQKEQELTTSKYNPHLNKINKIKSV